jgi:mannose-6-phosphate isomerase-like protein (cupin superfamily)
MDFKEFNFDSDIRVCIYNIDDENLSFHRHSKISDITICTRGSIIIEIPENELSVVLSSGQVFQVPMGKKHRCINDCPARHKARYILIQVGKFDIEFYEFDSQEEIELTRSVTLDKNDKKIIIPGGKNTLASVKKWFEGNTPENISSEEHEDICSAINIAMKQSNLF